MGGEPNQVVLGGLAAKPPNGQTEIKLSKHTNTQEAKIHRNQLVWAKQVLASSKAGIPCTKAHDLNSLYSACVAQRGGSEGIRGVHITAQLQQGAQGLHVLVAVQHCLSARLLAAKSF